MKSIFIHIVCLCGILGGPWKAYAQEPEQEPVRLTNAMPTPAIDTASSVVIKKPHSPRKAAIFSAVVPGLGQAYNKKYWKVPIVYAGLVTSIYFIQRNRSLYKRYKTAFVLESDGDSTTVSEFSGRFFNVNSLRSEAEAYQNFMELSFVAAGVIYILNIVDATVDAHFFDYKKHINDDLSLSVSPHLPNNFAMNQKPWTGVGLTVNLSFR